jgi:hypothetical protein
MKKITGNNYESYLLDFIEGKLDKTTKEELLRFLDNNPDIKNEVDSFEDIKLPEDIVSFPQKETLKKEIITVGNINKNNYEENFIAYYENDLNSIERKNVKIFTELNPVLKKEFEISSKLKLPYDKSIIYVDKQSLKRKNNKILLFWLSSAAAASIIILFGILFLLKSNVKQENNSNIYVIKHVNDVSAEEDNIANTVTTKPHHPDNEPTLQSDKTFTYNTNGPSNENHLSKNTKHVNNNNIILQKKSNINPVFLKSLSSNITLVKEEFYCRIKKRDIEKRIKQIYLPKQKDITKKMLTAFLSKAKTELKPYDPVPNTKDPALVKALESTINVFSKITGNEPDIERYYNDEGELIAYKYSGNNLNIVKNIKSDN